MNYRERITVEPGKRGGRPCIRGLRISVDDVLEQLAAGHTPEQIIEDFPELDVDDIRAALAFAADRQNPARVGGMEASHAFDYATLIAPTALLRDQEVDRLGKRWEKQARLTFSGMYAMFGDATPDSHSPR